MARRDVREVDDDGSRARRGDHRRPAGVDDATVEAMGKVSEAWEYVERVRGHLFALHQLMGRADLDFGDAADLLDRAGHAASARELRDVVVGRNILDGRWTFQIVEEFDDTYWEVFRAHEKAVRDALVGGRRHVYESEMKERRRTHGHEGHEARPD